MADHAKQCVFFVDDDLKICETASETLIDAGFEVSHFIHAADCLAQLRSRTCDLLVTDLKMPEMDGIELMVAAKRIAPRVPVLIVTAYGDILTAVTAIKEGAADFIEKPLARASFVDKVNSILKSSRSPHSYPVKGLTRREMRVLQLVLDGRTNREIAFLLKRSKRTIEVHRANLMKKLAADNLVELVERVVEMGLFKAPTKQDGREASENSGD